MIESADEFKEWSVTDLFDQRQRIADGIAAGLPQSRTDWTRALLATEIVFVSNVVGSGWQWAITTGFSDASTLDTLRRHRWSGRQGARHPGAATVNSPSAVGPSQPGTELAIPQHRLDFLSQFERIWHR